MKNFSLYVDSAANIPEAIRHARDIRVIPYHCTVNGDDRLCFDENVPFEETALAHYELLRQGTDIKTSLISSAAFYDALEPEVKAGNDVLLVIISSGVSGTFKQATDAAAMLMQDYPDRKVCVVDSANASMGEGLVALRLADLRDLGESIEACAKWGNENAFKVNSFFTVDDLKYLSRSGRISKTVAIAGTLLNVKPILQADGSKNAKITAYAKARGRKKALATIADIFARRAERPESQTVAITHADCLQDAQMLADMIRERGAKDIIIEYYDLCTVSHVGPGTLALFFWGTDRRNAATAAETQPAAKTIPKNA